MIKLNKNISNGPPFSIEECKGWQGRWYVIDRLGVNVSHTGTGAVVFPKEICEQAAREWNAEAC